MLYAVEFVIRVIFYIILTVLGVIAAGFKWLHDKVFGN